jgi:long-chain fatty acid transport protein
MAPGLAGRTAQANNAATVSSNPAGMARLDGFQLTLESIGAISDNHFKVQDGTTIDGGNPKNDLELSGLPLFNLAVPIGDRVRVGFGLSVPAGFGSDWGKSWAGRYSSQESTLFFISATPVVSVRVTDWLSLAAGVPVTYSRSENKVAIRNPGPNAEDGRAKLDVDGISVGASLSALLEPSERTRFGFSWRSESEPDMEGTPKLRNLSPLLEGALDAAGVLGEKVKLKMRVPQVIQFGFYHEFHEDWSVMGDMAWVDWSRFGKIDLKVSDVSTTLKVNYDDIWIGSFGVEHRFSERWRGGIGFSYVSSATSTKDRTVALPLDEIFLSGIGMYHQLSPRIGVQSNFMVAVGGDGKIDTQSGSAGRLVGKFERRISYVFQIGLVWGTPPARGETGAASASSSMASFGGRPAGAR